MSTIVGYILLSTLRGPIGQDFRPSEDDVWEILCSEADRQEYQERGFSVVPAKIVIEDGKP